MNDLEPETAVREPISVDDVPWETFSKGTRYGSKFRQLGAHAGCKHVGVTEEILEPGQQACPSHYHMLEEEHLMMLEGEVTLRLGDKRFTLEKGSYVCFPAGQKAGHALINESDAPCRYLLIGERNPNDVVVYPDSGRVSVYLLDEGYRKSSVMDYWEGQGENDKP
jgi:uncharacterized cupin superfamily protein